VSNKYAALKNKTKTGSVMDLPDIYQQARALEVRELADKVIKGAGRSASPEFLQEIAAAIADAANQRRGS